jgi:TPR repeat protein
MLAARLRSVLDIARAHLWRAERLGARGKGIMAVRHIAAAARAGSPEAQARLGQCYLQGQGVPVSIPEARHWLEKAAAVDNLSALIALAHLASRGQATDTGRGPFSPCGEGPPDHRLATSLARRAAAGGSAEAKALLAHLLEAAPDLALTPDEATDLYREAAEAGWPLGQLGHAMGLLRTGRTVEAVPPLEAAAAAGLPTARFLMGALRESGGDLAGATCHYRDAAEAGHITAAARLGLALLIGHGVPVNLTEAETWLRRAALNGEAGAAAVLGDFHANPGQAAPNHPEAARWYRRAAGLGHAGAARSLARLILLGAEGEPDPMEAAVWLRKAIEGGDHAAWPDLGTLLLAHPLPDVGSRDLREWLHAQMRAGHPGAGLYLGICLNNGVGAQANEAMALRYYLWAASLGAIEAMPAAAEMILNGRGIAADPALALGLFGFAARRNHAGASFALGLLHRRDPATAAGHFRKAAALGHPGAQAMMA